MKSSRFILLAPVIVFCCTAINWSSAFAAPVVGGDADAHGCKASAGYQYSSILNTCVRPWEMASITLDQTTTTGNTKIDNFISSETDKILKQFLIEVETSVKETGTKDPDRNILQIHHFIENTGSVISVRTEDYQFLGGAHGTNSIHTFNYHVKSGKKIQARQIFTKTMLENISKTIESQLDYTLDSWWKDGLNPNKIGNFSTFTLHTNKSGKIDTVTFFFQDTQIGPHAIGMPSFTFSYPELKLLSSSLKN